MLIKFLFNFSMGKYTLGMILGPVGSDGGCVATDGGDGNVIGFLEAAAVANVVTPAAMGVPAATPWASPGKEHAKRNGKIINFSSSTAQLPPDVLLPGQDH